MTTICFVLNLYIIDPFFSNGYLDPLDNSRERNHINHQSNNNSPLSMSSSQQNELDAMSKNCENRKSFSNTPNSALKSPISLQQSNDRNNIKELTLESDPLNLLENSIVVANTMKFHEDELENSYQSEVQSTPLASANTVSLQSNIIEAEADRIAREQRESELLAWQMMQEESAELYHIQIRFMQEIAGDMSAEDVRALQDAINESGRLDMLTTRAEANTISAVSNRTNGEESDHSDEFDEDDENDNESSEVDDPDEWDYDRLLDLGQQLGGNINIFIILVEDFH